MKQLRCRECRGWYDAKQRACPDCGTAPHAFNVHLVAARWSSALSAKAAAAAKDR